MSVYRRVNERVKRLQRGKPFPIQEFYRLGTRSSVQAAMSRIVKKGAVIRVARGIYVRPKQLSSTPSIMVTTSPEKVARTWAKLRGYKLASQGLEAAYNVGFQKQAPIRTVYWSDGPTREFSVGNARVYIRHVSDKKLRWIGRPEGLLLRAITVTKPEFIDIRALHLALKRLSLSGTQAKLVIQKLKQADLSLGWLQKIGSI